MYRYIVILGIFFTFALGQGVLEKENEYLQLQVTKQLAEQQLDSLNQSLEETLNWIDKEKSENNDEDKIAVFMSIALSITNNIDFQENQIKALNITIIKLEKELNTIYSKQMSSLEKRLKGDIAQQEKESIEQELIVLAAKRLSVFPFFNTFKFNPAKINTINISNIKDDLEKKISLEYLKSALAQVDSNIQVINEKTQELEDNRQLEDKANLFMDDVAESQVLGLYESSESRESMGEPTDVYNRNEFPIDKNEEWTYVQDNAIANTIDFLSQLEYMGMPSDDHINRFKISANDLITPEEYLEILKSSCDFLKLYRKMLLKKMAKE